MTTSKIRTMFVLLMLVCILTLFTACNQEPVQVLPSETPATGITPLPTVRPSATPFPTFTPWPTKTPEPVTEVDLVLADIVDSQEISIVGQDGTLLVGNDGYPWWNDAVFYEVFVRSFYDSDGDGIGDIQGLIQKLDYLNDGDPATDDDLGVTGIWLMPIMASPSYHGYDVTDYYTVEPDYGTNDDFLELMDEAHARGIHVIVDLVLNHTSSQHPWFIEAKDPNSDKRNWYVWSDSAGLRGWHETSNGYYYGIFWDQMPDLNYENPDVTAEMFSVVDYWLSDMGVDGFRLDAIKHLVEEDNVLENSPLNHAWFETFYTTYKDIDPQGFTVGEVWSPTTDILPYVGDEVDVCFEFDLADMFLTTAFTGRTSTLASRLEYILDSYPDGQFATFLANHDQSRVRSRLVNDGQAKVAASLQLTFPGIPFIYYGEEIGMQGAKPDENIRRPMQWTSDGGFSTVTPWHTYVDDVTERNVQLQLTNDQTLLGHYDMLIEMRNSHEALRTGTWWNVDTDRSQLVSLLRESDEEILLIVINTGQDAVTSYSLFVTDGGPLNENMIPSNLIDSQAVYQPTINTDGGFVAYRPVDEIPAYGIIILQFMK